MEPVSEILPFFRADEMIERDGRRLFPTTVDRHRDNNFSGLVGSEVIISVNGEAELYVVRGIERFMHSGPRFPGERIVLFAEPVSH